LNSAEPPKNLADAQRLQRLLDAISDYAICMLDSDGRVISWNSGAEKITGYGAADIIGRRLSRLFTPEDQSRGIPDRILREARTIGRSESEGWRVRADESRFWAVGVIEAIRDPDGGLLGFTNVTRDITERRAAREALHESERQFRLLVEGVTDHALYMLDPNGIVTNWNSGAERIKGYTADEIVGQHFSRFYTERERATGVPDRGLYVAASEGRLEAEGWRARKDGSLFWANVVIDAIRNDDGDLIGFANITRDITERREAEIALQKAQAQRDFALKMEALGQLTGGVAHDFNNLLMIVSGHLRTIKQLVAQDAKGTRAAEAIELAAQRGEALTRQLLSFSRRQTLNPIVAEIAERIEAVRAMLAPSVGTSALLVMNIPPDTWAVKIDVSEFELALVNIALNCRDAMPQGGVITISAENVQLRPEHTPDNLAGDFVGLTIADTGSGIAADILPKVFDPFFTTKKGSNGTGLGLSQVHGFAHQSGGTVVIDSELGRGTRITLYLPRANAIPEAAAGDAVAASDATGVALLVEDNPDVAEVTVALLEELGYQVHAVEDAQSALDAIERRKFDLVVSDIVMAGAMDGLGLAHTLRASHRDLPVILVTGYSDTAALAGTEFVVLRKPYQLADLSRTVERVIARHPATSRICATPDAGFRHNGR
jgi:PAS domain S-box-containing protein